MIRIAVTDTLGTEHKFQAYRLWLQENNIPLECVTISYKLGNLHEINECHGLVLTGGHDVDPLLYDGPEKHPTITDVDRLRDSF